MEKEKRLSLEDIYLLDENPRFKLNKESKERMKDLSYDDLNNKYQLKAARKLLSHEGKLKDLYDLLKSISDKGFREKNNNLILLKIEKDNKNKYLAADGNRRVLSLLLLYKKISFEEITSDKHKKLNDYKNIVKLLSEEKDKSTLFFEHSDSHNINDIEAMFEDINFNHTGSGNGKRIWARGKILEEIYEIYNKPNISLDKAIEEIIKDLGFSKTKAKDGIRNSIWFIELFKKYKNLNKDFSLSVVNISPSSVELIRSVKLPKEIIEHDMNTFRKDTLGKLFNIESDRKSNYKVKKDKLQLISFDSLSTLLIEGYKEEDKFFNEFDEDSERENDENQGLLKNIYFSTRSWTPLGTKKLFELLDWPLGTGKNQKISQIENDNKKIFKLDKDELINYAENGTFRSNSDLSEVIKILIATPKISISINKKKTSKTYNHIYKVLIITLNYEYYRVESTLSDKPYLLQENNTVSQLSVFRSMYELLNKLLYYISLDIFSWHENNLNLKEIIDKKIFAEHKKENDFSFYETAWNLFNKQDKTDLDLIFTQMIDNGSSNFFKDYFKIFELAKKEMYPLVNESQKKFILELKKELDEFHKIKKRIGKEISLPLHQFDKFVNSNDLETITHLNKNFIELFNIFKKLIDFLENNIEYIFKDEKLRENYS